MKMKEIKMPSYSEYILEKNSISSNIEYIRFRKKLIEDFYKIEDDIINDNNMLVKELKKLGYNSSILLADKIKSLKNLNYPSIVIVPHGDEDSWISLRNSEDLEDLKDLSEDEYILVSE